MSTPIERLNARLKGEWPWPQDTTLEKARRIANSVLEELRKTSPTTAESLVRQAHHYGQTWLGTTLVHHDAADVITTAEAATLLGRSPDMIRRWTCTPHPSPEQAAAGVMLLSRWGLRGREQTYLVAHLWQAQADYETELARKALARRNRRRRVAA